MPNFVKQLGKNIFSSWASLGFRVILVFLVNPFIIHTLGDSQYGVWVLVISIINYMTILDLGMKQALIRFISKYLGVEDFNKINSVINSCFIIYSIVGLLVVLITLILSFFALSWFKIPPEFIGQGRVVLLIIGFSTALNFVMLSWSDSLGAFHRYDVSNGLTMGEDLLRTIAIVLLLQNGYGLIAFAAMFAIFNLLKNIAGTGILKKLYPQVKLSFKLASKETLRTIFNYSIIGFLISVAWLLIVNTDNVLIAYFLNTAAVTQYAIAAGFIVYLRSLILAVSFPLRPLVSHYEAVGKSENISFIYTRGIKYLCYLTFVIGGGAIIFADSFILLWMGEGYEKSAEILKILILPAALALPQLIANSVMYGIEKHRNLLYIIIVEGIFNLVLSIILVKYYGLRGIAYGTIVPQVIIYLIVVPPIIKSMLNFRLFAFYISMFKSIAVAFLLSCGLSYLIKRVLMPSNWGLFFGEIVIVAAISLVLGYFLANKDELKSIINRFRN